MSFIKTPGPAAKAKLFAHGGSQAVRLPKEFRFEGKEVTVRKDGDAVILGPVKRDFSELWARLDALAEAAGEPFADLERPEQPDAPPPVDLDR